MDYSKIDKDINYTEVSKAQFREYLFGETYIREVGRENIIYKDKDGVIIAVYRRIENECYIPNLVGIDKMEEIVYGLYGQGDRNKK